MTQTLYYFGPQHTFSHAAALHFLGAVSEWGDASLLPFSSAETIFYHVRSNPSTGAVVPYFNQTQGDVYDFMRFHLLEEVATFDLAVEFCLATQAESLDQVRTVFTKDTVPPQVSIWIKENLSDQINLVASTEISTAEAARRAARNPTAAAICSAASAEAYGLSILCDVPADRPDNFTRFGLFTAAGAEFTPPHPIFDPVEYSLNLTPADHKALLSGQHQITWHLSIEPEHKLHLGHLSALITLHKLYAFGNLVSIRPENRLSLAQKNGIRGVLGPSVPISGSAAAEIALADFSQVQTYKQSGQKAILLDFVPGLDGYARMDHAYQNGIPWPIPRKYWTHPALTAILGRHFSPDRILAAGVQAPLLMA